MAIYISFQTAVISSKFVIVITSSSKLMLSVFKSQLLSSEIVATSINKSLSILNSLVSSGMFHLKTLKLVVLISRLSSFHVIKLFVALDFSPHFSSLNLYHFDFLLKVGNLSS